MNKLIKLINIDKRKYQSESMKRVKMGLGNLKCSQHLFNLIVIIIVYIYI